MAKRLFDIVFSFLGILILSPFFLVISLLVGLTSKGGVFFIQQRVGKGEKDFGLIKFRSMKKQKSNTQLITIGNDSRITFIGKYIRNYKLDELPQLINVLKGDMSFVGPRPEVRYYVEMYTAQQRQVLTVRPGITDPASIKYRDESNILSQQKDPTQYYINVVMPEKLKINLDYISRRTFFSDVKIIFQTFKAI